MRYASCFGGSIRPQRIWVPRHNRTTYKFIFGVFIVLKYYILNFGPFQDRLVLFSFLVRKMLDLRPFLEVQYGRKGFGYLYIRERPINLYSVLLSYCNTKYLIWGYLEIYWSRFQSWYVKGEICVLFWRFISAANHLGT